MMVTQDDPPEEELKEMTEEVERQVLDCLRVARQDRQYQLTHLQAFAAVLIAANLAIIGLLGGFFKPAAGTGTVIYCAYYASLAFLLASLMIGLVALRPRYRATSLKAAADDPYRQHIRQEKLLLRRQRWLGAAHWCLCLGLALGVFALILP